SLSNKHPCLSFHITIATSTQQDIYATGSESRPPMLNKENYVPWSSRLLWYAKSRPNGKLIHNSILNGPYVRRMIPEPAYHPQTSGQVEVSNRGLKRILERTIGENRASWSDKLDDALWAFRTAYKIPIGCTPYKLVYGKDCPDCEVSRALNFCLSFIKASHPQLHFGNPQFPSGYSLMFRVGLVLDGQDSDESGVTYTDISSPFEELSDIGSPRADDHEHFELPEMLEDPYVEVALQAPPSLDYLPSASRRDDRPEVTLPPRKKLGIALGPRYEVGERSYAAAARPAGGLRADYGFVATMDRETMRDPEREVGYGITDSWDEIVETLQGAPVKNKFINQKARQDVIDIAYEEFTQDVLDFKYNSKSGNPTLVSNPLLSKETKGEFCKELIVKPSSPTLTPFGESDFLLEEIEYFLKDESIPTGIEDSYYDPEGDILYLEKLLNDDPSQLPPMDLKQAEETKEKSLIEEPLELELKELPSHLEYAFLEETNKLPLIIAKDLKDVVKEALLKVLKSHKWAIAWKITDIKGVDKLPLIIAKDLKVDEKEALLKVHKSHKRAIAWKIIDIKGIDPRFCTHKIFKEEDYKPAVQSQIQVNPKIHEVIKKEVIKLLDAGMIYLISDSPWVSLIHCVPKKGGITVVENEDNKLIPTRVLVTKPHNKTPYEFLHGRLPSIGFMRPFGCPITILDTLDPLGKFQGKVDEGFLVGYSLCSKAFRVFNSRTRIVQETLHVNFMENEPNVAGSGPAWLFDIDSLSQTMNYHPNNNKDALVDGKEHDIQKSVSLDIHSSSSGALLATGIEVDREKVDVIAKLPHPTTVKGSENLAADHLSRLENPHKDVLENKDINENFPLETLGSISSESTPWFADIANSLAGNFIKKRVDIPTKEEILQGSVDYLSKWVEAKALPINDARVVIKFLKSLFARFGTPRAIISDHGTHFCNDQFAKVMTKYGVTHRLATACHSQTSRQVEISDRDLKRILERTLQLNELNELHDQAYENSLIYKERTKKLHDSKIKNRIFNVGDHVLLFNTHLKLFSGKLKTRWSGPFTITQVFLYGTVELSQPDGPNFKVNGHRVKHYFAGDIPSKVVPDLHTIHIDK
nr:reverse transcriptase domain-containing protein [Tanacetum cinerariifolium]